ncbi:M48 family metallopeptidase [Paenibacillus harenae]|uniref:M48 family metallopeptidase n=1 Tax=Paenibacillus harenae TaxID=306543 RepID=UPI00279079F7|nr:SprT family zinc-dependent metalloprotease [Paenibacillus harenae]MDQ0062890.1 putative metal-dependent hydrolase [Paenibacillus harenae]
MKIEFENQTISFNVLYGTRSKLSIQMDSLGHITVKAPNGTSDEQLMRAVERHGKAILGKLNAIAAAQAIPQTRDYQEQGKFLHLGKYYFLHELIETDGLNEDELKSRLKKFYISSCKKLVGERIKIYQAKLKVKPKSIDVVESTTKWGSCSSDRHLLFNYRLAMAPIDVIDYVIVHELCHLLHMNHDRSFWRRVGSIMPDYEEKEAYLARHGHAMTL